MACGAGFDGVEVHGANGYLLDQFLRSGSNTHTDAYGGGIENRARLLLEVMQAVTQEIGGDRVGLRLSPVTPTNDAQDPHPQPLFEYVVTQLARLNLAFLHIIEGATGGADLVAFGRPFIANPDLTRRLREGASFNEPDRATFYGGGAKGYTDYPALA